ncbi:MAG: OsmC domain/YcaO domain-containing protein [Planctomycetes bacterium]|nr:OsmC domain/YcaO domain-containing protein [Planctomycetota bacterium]
MEINVRFLENLRLEANFDDFSVVSDQPIRYKGDGSAPNPFDYFLASSALCAAYFVRIYCLARDIPTEDIRISQHNVIDPDNRYNQILKIHAELPASISQRDRDGILKSIDRCTVKKVIQAGPGFEIEAVESLGQSSSLIYAADVAPGTETLIPGKDLPLEKTISNMTGILADLGIKIEVASWRNIVPNVWSVHIRDAASPMCFTNGKGASKESALCSALGEYIERSACNYFYNDHFLGEEIADSECVHYPEEKWFQAGPDDALPEGLMDENCLRIYNPDQELKSCHLIDTNSGRSDRGICAVPFTRQSDHQIVYMPVNLIGNLFVSNGMSAGNTLHEAQVQCLSEILERGVKKRILEDEMALPEVPRSVLEKFPGILAGVLELEAKGFPVLVKDASLGGRFPVMCVTLMNPKTGGVFASFGAHPKFEVALERSLTELLQGRSFEGLNDVPQPTFNSQAVTEPNNFVDHFIDSTGIVSWRFFSDRSDHEFCEWDFSGTTEEESKYLMDILKAMDKEVYVAVHDDLGGKACRILVPGYSEIYSQEDLVWDNTNKALGYREDILNLHALDAGGLSALVERLEESGLSNFTTVSGLIGIEFDENTVWGQLNVGELKILVFLALERFEEARDLVAEFLTFNDNTSERNLFHQALNAVLEITLDERLDIEHYLTNLTRMFGSETMTQVMGSITGEVRFSGLTPTSMKLEGLDKHIKLIESYKKLHRARTRRASLQSDEGGKPALPR